MGEKPLWRRPHSVLKKMAQAPRRQTNSSCHLRQRQPPVVVVSDERHYILDSLVHLGSKDFRAQLVVETGSRLRRTLQEAVNQRQPLRTMKLSKSG